MKQQQTLSYDARFRVGYFESIFRNSVTGVAWCYTISMAHISYIGFGVRVWGLHRVRVSYIGFGVRVWGLGFGFRLRVHCVTPCNTV